MNNPFRKSGIKVKTVDVNDPELAKALSEMAEMFFGEPAKPEQHPNFFPHLEGIGPCKEWIGAIGAPTVFKDSFGKRLCVGDVVEAYGKPKGGDFNLYTLSVVGIASENYSGPLGFGGAANQKEGIVKGWSIFKVRSFSSFEYGDVAMCGNEQIRYVLKEKK